MNWAGQESDQHGGNERAGSFRTCENANSLGSETEVVSADHRDHADEWPAE